MSDSYERSGDRRPRPRWILVRLVDPRWSRRGARRRWRLDEARVTPEVDTSGGWQVMVVEVDITKSRRAGRDCERQSRVPRTNGGGRTWSAMTRARAIPANRAIPSLYICIWRWRSPGSLLRFGGFQRGNGECWRGSRANSARERTAIGVGRARRTRRPRKP